MAEPPTAPAKVPEEFLHKNRLQEYAQRSSIALPLYQTINEGSQHAPKFRATVVIDGSAYWSTQTFTNRKAAEQDVAREALEGISKKIKDEGCPLIHEDTVFCKSILNEYAVKMNLEKPTYATTQPKGLLPTFVSSIDFNGKRYTGDPGRNKREAEQIAARAVILSILGNSNSRTLLSQIIKSKGKLYAALHKVNNPGLPHDINVVHVGNFQNTLTNGNNVGTLPATGSVPQVGALSQVIHGGSVPQVGAISQVIHGGSVPQVGTVPQSIHGLCVPQAGTVPHVHGSCVPQTAIVPHVVHVQLTQHTLPELKQPKEEVLWEGPGNIIAMMDKTSGPSGPTCVFSGSSHDESHHNKLLEASAVNPVAQSLPLGVDACGRKRSRKNKRKDNLKKARTDGQQAPGDAPPAIALDSGAPPAIAPDSGAPPAIAPDSGAPPAIVPDSGPLPLPAADSLGA